jgi:outer membrane protein OmpA-like peptidoglycan-associated protein
MNIQKNHENSAKSGSITSSAWPIRLTSLAVATLTLTLLTGCSQTTPTSTSEATSPEVASAPSSQKIDLRGVEFRRDGAIQPKSKPVLDAAAQLLKAQTDAKVYVDAYCDPSGGPELNQRIAEARAAAVKAYLVKDGVPGDRLIARGYGATNFVASNATVDGRKQNRRIELVITRS